MNNKSIVVADGLIKSVEEGYLTPKKEDKLIELKSKTVMSLRDAIKMASSKV